MSIRAKSSYKGCAAAATMRQKMLHDWCFFSEQCHSMIMNEKNFNSAK